MTSPAYAVSDADKRDGARRAYRESVAGGTPLTGAQLGDMFGMSERWGRGQITASKKALHIVGDGEAAPRRAVTPSPTPPAVRPRAAGPATPFVRLVATVGAVVVAVIAAASSYVHMRDLAAANGQGEMAWLQPLVVDGLMVVASMVMLVRRREGRAAWLATTAMVTGIAASLWANVAAADPNWVARVWSALPPLALFVAYELVLQLRTDRPRKKK